jgi:two-component system cell cycle sensor histidine kinase/response regulator CckA
LLIPFSMLALVVDDDPKIRAYIKAILRRESFETLEAEGGNPALEIVERVRGRIDLVVTDLQMPNGDGLSFATAVRETFPSIPIILSSGRTKPDTVFEFVEKPFAAETLAQVIRKLVARPAKTA